MGLFLLIYYILLSASLYKVFEKAGRPGWQALAPGYNFVVWAQLVGRKGIYAAWMLFPIVNFFIFAGLCIDLVRSFGKLRYWHSVVAVVLAPAAFFYLGLSEKEKYGGPVLDQEKEYQAKLEEAKTKNNSRQAERLQAQNPYKKSAVREWVEAVVFAVFAAAFIRMFLIEAYVIPTPSMEGSLMVGDFLFVSKAHYGIRMPQTIAMIPLLHNRIPVIGGESYLDKPSLEYCRLPALESIDHNDPVVFNFPAGDSVYVFPDRTWTVEDLRYGAIREANPGYEALIRAGKKKLITRPVDKEDHYIKRCIGLPGDSLQVRNRQVYINGQAAQNPAHIQFLYQVTAPDGLNGKALERIGLSPGDVIKSRDLPANMWLLFLSNQEKEAIMSADTSVRVDYVDFSLFDRNPLKLFPHDPKHFSGWTNDNYGPVYIPKKGATVQISPENIALYSRIIHNYEGNDLEVKNGKVYINGQESTSYTFKMNYYWMMGDNRHNSEDSRVWGFVPEDHIVGKPLFIWFSIKEGKNIFNGINWKRIFKSATTN